MYSTSPTYIKAFDGTQVSTSPIGTSYQNAPQSLASTWGDNLTSYFNGIPDASPAAYDGTMGAGNLGIGNRNDGANLWNGTVREVKIFNSELTAEEVGDL